MSIPNRFKTKITTGTGVIEAKTLKTEDKILDLDFLIQTIDTYTQYITDETIKKLIYYSDNSLKSFDGTFSFDKEKFKQDIITTVNLYVDNETGYVEYYLSDNTQKEIRISDAAYLDSNNKKILNVNGDEVLDIDALNSKINEINLKYVSTTDDDGNTHNNITDFDGNTIINDADKINSILNDLDNDIKEINLKYDSDNDNITDSSGNKLLSNVKEINNNILNNKNSITEIETNIKKELIYKIVVTYDSENDSSDIAVDKILDPDSALGFEVTDNKNGIKVSIDTDKIATSELGILFSPGSNSDGEIYLLQYKNINKNDNGNVTDFVIESYKLDGTPELNFEMFLTLKY